MSFAENAVLLVIDVQQGFADPVWGARNNPLAEANIAVLGAAWAASGRPIVVVRHDSVSPGSPLAPGQPGNDLRAEVAVLPCDLLVTKSVNSAFYGEPALDPWLRERATRELVIVGVQTNMCVETTARMAGNLGYDVTVPLDATHTFDLAGPAGAALTADELATATAVNLQGGGFARIATTSEVLENL
ncbi:MAG TPA: cysteine hydrolase family protein [Microbacteriaceae bacterium]|nr:cysteine hydrolase family protein [Microbacteriaceae bacterium]